MGPMPDSEVRLLEKPPRTKRIFQDRITSSEVQLAIPQIALDMSVSQRLQRVAYSARVYLVEHPSHET